MTAPVERLCYRPNEAATATGMSRDVIFRLMRTGELRSFKVGTARLIAAEELRDFMRRRQEEAEGKAT